MSTVPWSKHCMHKKLVDKKALDALRHCDDVLDTCQFYNTAISSLWVVCESPPSRFRDIQAVAGATCSEHSNKYHKPRNQQSKLAQPRTSSNSRRPRSNDSLSRRQREHSGSLSAESLNASHPLPGPVNHAMGAQKQKRSTMYPWRDIPDYSFVHHTDRGFYMGRYREKYTDTKFNHQSLPASCLLVLKDRITNQPRLQQPIRKAVVESICTDVGDSAFIRPYAAKLTQFPFDIANRFRAEKMIDTHFSKIPKKHSTLQNYIEKGSSEQSSTQSKHINSQPVKLATLPPRNWSTDSKQGMVHTFQIPFSSCTLPMDAKVCNFFELPQKVPSSMNNPVVSRSRPSIPSNARGIVCPTAVKTPLHVIQVNHNSSSSMTTILTF